MVFSSILQLKNNIYNKESLSIVAIFKKNNKKCIYKAQKDHL